MAIIQVAVGVPLRQLFSYQHTEPLAEGVRVRVPFGRRELIGVTVTLTTQQEPDPSSELKSIIEVIDTRPVISGTLLSLCKWLASYYHHPIGEVMQAALPVRLRKGESAEVKQVGLTITAKGHTALQSTERSAPKQRACLALLAAGPLPIDEVKGQYSTAVIKALTEKEWIEQYTYTPTITNDSWVKQLDIADVPRPNKEQAVALATVARLHHQFTPFLLDGVTGSGKTEVYLQAIEPILFAGKQVLILVPEIGLTPQTVGRFKHRFGIEVGVLHSQLTDTARLDVWQKAKNGQLGIILGTRSAIFTPLKNPGMIIVDEEHDDSFKQQDGLRYNARDLAVVRAQTDDVPLLLGSATPSLETLNNALTKRYHHLTLTSRAGGAAHTLTHVFDAREQPLQAGIAQGLVPVIKQHLDAGNQVMIFLNRRGYAPALLCHHCGQSVDCSSCERPYTLHKVHQRLQCHQCGKSRPVPHHCSQCHSTDLQTSGMGTEQLEQGLAALFPGVSQVRIDSDAVRGKDKLQTRLNEINDRQYQLLIGTQILSKGHHFPHVTLVVVLDCDGAQFSADFRAPEKFAQLVTQLAGRAGRASKPGEMYLQTYNPGHPLLQDLIQNGFSHFARHALLERKMALLPPFSSQGVFRAEATQGDLAFRFLQTIQTMTPQESGLQQIGPIPALIEKRQGRYRFMLVLQATQRARLHKVINRILHNMPNVPLASKVRWSVDVDPSDFT